VDLTDVVEERSSRLKFPLLIRFKHPSPRVQSINGPSRFSIAGSTTRGKYRGVFVPSMSITARIRRRILDAGSPTGSAWKSAQPELFAGLALRPSGHPHHLQCAKTPIFIRRR